MKTIQISLFLLLILGFSSATNAFAEDVCVPWKRNLEICATKVTEAAVGGSVYRPRLVRYQNGNVYVSDITANGGQMTGDTVCQAFGFEESERLQTYGYYPGVYWYVEKPVSMAYFDEDEGDFKSNTFERYLEILHCV